MELGRILQVTAAKPRYHGTEDGRWDYRVTIVWKNVETANDDFNPEPIIKQLYPDQETFKREEQRRFEILLAHWDLPITSVNLDEK
jgi:nitric oxide reductase activation protein